MTETSTRARRWYRPMVGRDPDEEHRTATTLELFFDLCFVVAVAAAAAELHHAIAEDHVGDALTSYPLVFFAIWWAWMNFTWFASAYDTDDVPYRLLVMVQIAGALVMAAGVREAFESRDLTVMTLGYVIMRLALVPQWLRAARSHVEGRQTGYRYAVGVSVLQVAWVARLALPEDIGFAVVPVLIMGELAVPAWAEAKRPTSWHPDHITERYGLFTIIVLGESVLAATTAISTAVEEGSYVGGLVPVIASGVVIVFAMWWVYFDKPPPQITGTSWAVFRWGYGHLVIFAAVAAVGAGLQVAVDHETGKAHISDVATNAAVAIPVAVFLLAVWVIHVRPRHPGPIQYVVPAAAAIVLAAALTGAALPLIALVMSGLVVVSTAVTSHEPAAAP